MSNYVNDVKNPNQRPSWSWFGKEFNKSKSKVADRRFWVFVQNNPSSHDFPKKLKDLSTVTWQLEEGSRKIPHIQGVVQFLYPKSFSQVRAMLPKAWWQVMLGTHEEAKAYCSKLETRTAGPWSHDAVLQAVEDCLSGLSGEDPLHPGDIIPAPLAQIADSVVPPHAVATPRSGFDH